MAAKENIDLVTKWKPDTRFIKILSIADNQQNQLNKLSIFTLLLIVIFN